MEKLVTDEIKDTLGNSHDYTIYHGKNSTFNIECNRTWSKFEFDVLQRYLISSMKKDDIYNLISELQFHDLEWDWLTKYFCYSDDKVYDWFFLKTDTGIQAVTLTSHPKESVFRHDDIFYIEYIAVAPWNRTSKYYNSLYKGLGTTMMKVISEYFSERLGYRHGFSLSAVPQAIPFYEKIGMTSVPLYNENGLSFYEFEEDKINSFLGGSR